MNARNVLTVVLLSFVAVSVIAMVVKQRELEPVTSGPVSIPEVAPLVATSAPTLPENGVAALYFHGDTRCPTCQKIETNAQEAVATNFAAEMKRGTVTWQDVNYETPANRHYLEEFGLVAPTLVLVKTNHGQQVDWRNLDRVWQLVGDPGAFSAYVEEGVNSFLAEGSHE